jgi:hypothetical protein
VAYRRPEGYHAAPPGGKPGKFGLWLGRMLPPGTAWSGCRRDATRFPACKIINGCQASERRHDTRRHRTGPT